MKLKDFRYLIAGLPVTLDDYEVCTTPCDGSMPVETSFVDDGNKVITFEP